MCGIAGYWNVGDAFTLARMTAAVAHRGPDDAGEWHSLLVLIDIFYLESRLNRNRG